MTATIPKAELHCHIEGAASPALVEAQAGRYGIDVSAIIDGGRFVWSDFTTFLDAYDVAAGLFRTAQDYALLSETYLSSIAADGAIYSEIFVSPDHARKSGIDPAAYLDGLGEGAGRAKEATGIECRMIVVGIRHFGSGGVTDAARFAASRPHPLVTGFGMAGEERFGRVADYARAFDIARGAGLGITIHAGELAGADSVRDALDHVRPARIGHGVRAIEDPELVRRLADEGVVLETCPGSNIAVGVFPSFKTHPLPALAEAGVRVTLNSDDPPYFATSLGREYAVAATEMGFDEAALRAMTRTAVEVAFVDEATRGKLLDML